MSEQLATQFPVQKRVALRAVEIEAIELAAQGLNQREIGERIGRTRSGVGKMLRRVETKLARELKETGEQIKARQTLFLENIFRQAMRSFELSKSDATGVKTVSTGEDSERVETTSRSQVGDARFLAEARGALADVRKIWGLDEADTRNQPPNANVTIRIEYSEDFFGSQTNFNSHTFPVDDTPLITDDGDVNDNGQKNPASEAT